MPVLDQIERLLTTSIGVNIQSLGTSSVARVVRERMAARGLNDESQYLELVTTSDQERQELIDAAVVPETWFFRDESAFRMLQKYVIEEWLPQRSDKPLRVMSLPCSTGEEAYSLAMALFDIGLISEQFRIEAYDVSQVSLAKAERATYGKNSFRGRDLSFRSRYFQCVDGISYTVNEKVRNTVVFASGNVLDPAFPDPRGPYDIIFFRNLMIYFDKGRQEQALAAIDRMLSGAGLVFIGHSEPSPLMDRWFSSVRYPLAFAYRKHSDDRRQRTAKQNAAPRLFPDRRKHRPVSSLTPCTRREAPVVAAPAPTPVPVVPVDPNPLDEARKLADQGRLDEARHLCQNALRDSHVQPEAYYLLGLIESASGASEQAEEYFRKTVYLDPHHVHALTHLALAAIRRGDEKNADLFKRRAQRAEMANAEMKS